MPFYRQNTELSKIYRGETELNAIYRGETELWTKSLGTQGLVLHLDAANETTGATTWNDLSGNNNNFISTGNVSWNSLNGGVFDFNGGYFNFVRPSDNANNGLGVFDSQDYTIEAWTYLITSRLGSFNTPCIWSYDHSSHTPPYYVQQMRHSYTNNQAWGSTGIGSVPQGTGIQNGWAYTVAVKDLTNSTVGIYQQGQSIDNGTNLASPVESAPFTNQEVWIGRFGYGDGSGYYTYSGNWGGYMAIIRIWSRALSSTEILNTYNAERSRFGL